VSSRILQFEPPEALKQSAKNTFFSKLIYSSETQKENIGLEKLPGYNA